MKQRIRIELMNRMYVVFLENILESTLYRQDSFVSLEDARKFALQWSDLEIRDYACPVDDTSVTEGRSRCPFKVLQEAGVGNDRMYFLSSVVNDMEVDALEKMEAKYSEVECRLLYEFRALLMRRRLDEIAVAKSLGKSRRVLEV